MKKNIYNIVVDLLKNNDKYVDDEGRLLKAKIYSDVMTMNQELIELLLSDENVKKEYFTKVGNNFVFDKQGFGWLIESKEFLPDSYTKYANKIGLDSDNKLLSKQDDIVLDFPYKDCFLEGGQTKVDQKRNEIFFNETIAKDEITRMLSPKIFTECKKISKDGVQKNNVTFNYGDNLFIKGNNLISIASLLPKFKGKIKLIYIDPPYNTANDTFNYNDTFNRSTWLTFMKNRLEIAKQLLAPEGSIYVQLDYNQVHYAKVLMDEIFGENNFQREIIWRMGFVSGYKTNVNNYIRNHDTILFYSRNNEKLFFKKNYIPNDEFNEIVKESKDLFKFSENLGISDENMKKLLKYINYDSRGERYPLEDTWNCNKWDELNSIAIESSTSRVDETVMIDGENFKGQKPEKLLKRIIEASTKEGDYVLDFFAGTGTTGVTAHKLNRHYILCEQMDYSNKIVERITETINGSQDGISKSVNWQGGGSCIYCELKENAKQLIDKIAKSSEDRIDEIKDQIFNDDRIVSYITKDDLKNSNNDFNSLEDIEEKKKVLIKLIDKNKLYVNYSDIDDKNYKITEDERIFTNSFYSEEE